MRLFRIVPFRTIAGLFAAFAVAVPAFMGVLVGGYGLPGVLWVAAAAVDVLLAVVFVVFVVRLYRPFLADLDRIRAGDHWAHWTYTADEWHGYNRLEARRDWRNLRAQAVVTVVLALGMTVLGIVGPGLVLAGLVLLGALVYTLSSGAVVARRRPTGDVYVTPFGVYRDPGGYQPLFAVGQRLREVALDELPGPPHVRFACDVRGRYGTKVGFDMAHVLVPAGRLADAQALVERFRSDVLGQDSGGSAADTRAA